jgi:hypothetical protein
MHVLLQVLTTVPPKSSVPDVVFSTTGAIASALEGEFVKYMDSFLPFLIGALGNQEDSGLCSVAIGLVSDVSRALNEKVQPYCDTFMNYLLTILRVSNRILTNMVASANCLLGSKQPVEACDPRNIRRHRAGNWNAIRHVHARRWPGSPAGIGCYSQPRRDDGDAGLHYLAP